jgi:pyruvate formate lyase activating enzyme
VTPAPTVEATGCVFNVMRFSTHDGPGIRTAVFFKGCPLACWWCHNPESQSLQPEILYFEERCRNCGDCLAACAQHAIERVDGTVRTTVACRRCGHCAEVCLAEARQMAGRRVNVGELIAEIEKDVVFYDDSGGGVTLSGGEPFSQPQFAGALLAACRERRIHTVVETCGFVPPEAFLDAALAADAVLFDLKLVDPEKHRVHTGVRNDGILRNLEALVARRRAVTVRIPVIPGINDTEEDIGQFARYLAGLQAPVELLPYHHIGAAKYRRLGRSYKLEETPEPAAVDLASFAGTLARAGLTVKVGGGR